MSRKYTAEEFPNYFAIKYDGDSKAFKVAKSGLSKDKQDVIRMACGGKVKKYQEGGEVTQEELDAGMSLPNRGQPVDYGTKQDVNALVDSLVATPEPVPAANLPIPTVSDTFIRPTTEEEKAGMSLVQPSLAQPGQLKGARYAPPIPTNVALTEPPSHTETTTAGSSGRSFGYSPIGIPDLKTDTKELDKAIEDQNRSIAIVAAFQAKQDKIKAEHFANLEKTKQDKMNEYELSKREIDSKRQKLADDILNGKEDPNRYWHSLGAGNQVGTMASVLFSGLGAAIAGRGGQNKALDMFQRNIDRDIEAQRQDLGRKKSILSDYIAQGNNLTDSYRLTDAYLKDLSAIQLEKIAATIPDDVQRAQAAATAAKFKIESMKTREEILAKQLDNKYEPFKMEAEAKFKNAQMENMRAMNAWHLMNVEDRKKERQEKIDNDKKITAIESGFSSGNAIDPVSYGKMSQKQQERAVRNPDGNFVAAISAKEGAELRAKSIQTEKVKEYLDELKEISRRNNGAPVPGRGTGTADRARAEELRQLAVSSMAALGNTGVVSPTEVPRLIALIPDINSFTTFDNTIAGKFGALYKDMDNQMFIHNKNLLVNPSTMNTVKSVPGEQGARTRIVVD